MHALEPAYAAYASKFVIITLHYITLHSNICIIPTGAYTRQAGRKLEERAASLSRSPGRLDKIFEKFGLK